MKPSKQSLTKNMEKFFIVLMLLAVAYLVSNWYKSKVFKDNPISYKAQERVLKAEEKVLSLINKKFDKKPQIPLIVSDDFNSNLYGLTVYKDNQIKIYLNKKRFQESEDYMIEEVIPHEYAHAMVFLLGKKTSKDGHTSLWQKICLELEGKQCVQYVDNEAIVREKMNSFFR